MIGDFNDLQAKIRLRRPSFILKISGSSLTRRLSVVNIGTVERRLSTFNLATIPHLGIKDTDDTIEDMKRSPFDWFHEPQFYLIGLCYLSSRLAFIVSVVYIVYYVEFTLLLEKENNAIVPLVMFISGFVMSGILEVAKRRLSIEIIFVSSCIVGIGKFFCLLLKKISRIIFLRDV